jgi:toxin CcdB
VAQFDVHRNTGKQRETIPFVVVVQSSLYDSYRRRVVIPLVRRSRLDRSAAFVDSPLNPVFTVKGIKVVLHPLEIVSVATDQLGEKVATLVQEGDRITGAMDGCLRGLGRSENQFTLTLMTFWKDLPNKLEHHCHLFDLSEC